MAGKTSGGGDAGFNTDFDKEMAWELLFPERCEKYHDIKARRTAKRCGFTLPEDRIPVCAGYRRRDDAGRNC
jgi:hypothetical protein